MKHKVLERYIAAQGIESYDTFVGLRADEPDRVSRLRSRETQAKGFRCPLFAAKIRKSDVLAFWAQQSFNLEIEENQGNCTACFLKDQSDLSRVLQEEDTDAAFWLQLEKDFPRFGGQNFPGFAQLLAEGPARVQIEQDLREGIIPQPRILAPRRHRLVVLQEKRRLAGQTVSFSCACEASYAIDE